MNMFLNNLIWNAHVKMAEMLICEKILITSGYRNKIYFKTNGDTLLSVV
jgi:hypothetical protein